MSNENLTPDTLSKKWLAKSICDKQKVTREGKKFILLSGGVGMIKERDLAMAKLQKQKEIAITQFSLKAFAKNFRLLHKAIMSDARDRAPTYSEPAFERLASLLGNNDSLRNINARNEFMAKHTCELGASDISMEALRKITLEGDTLRVGNHAKPRSAIEWVRARIAKLQPKYTPQNIQCFRTKNEIRS